MGHVHEATVLELNDADSVFLVGGVLRMHHFLSNRSLFTVAAELTPNPPGCAGVVILSPGVLDLRRALNLKEVQDKLGCSTADTEAVLKDGFVALRHWFEKPNINDANSFKPTRGGMVPLFAAPPGAPANAKQPAHPRQRIARRCRLARRDRRAALGCEGQPVALCAVGSRRGVSWRLAAHTHSVPGERWMVGATWVRLVRLAHHARGGCCGGWPVWRD
jgi:hypothetical protein